MREIKFRAWIGDRKALKEVVRYEKHDNGFSVSYLDSIGDELAPMYSNSHSIELMQYTGLKDKNGKEIYEGDIVEFRIRILGHRYEKSVCKVSFIDGSYMITKNKELRLWNMNCEVIGNIYESPELLEN